MKKRCSIKGCTNQPEKDDTKCHKHIIEKYYSVWFKPYNIYGHQVPKYTLEQFDNAV